MNSYGICNLSVVPVRAEPSDKSEIQTQLLFGDHFELTEVTEKWVRIKIAYDGYEGWIDPKQFYPIDSASYNSLNDPWYVSELSVSQPLAVEKGETVYILPGSCLPFFDGTHITVGERKYSFNGIAKKPNPQLFSRNVESAAKFYLHTPYLWGGKSPFGIDCSGLTQMVFKQFGIKIMRDTWQQAEQGDTVKSLADIKQGDLAFFDNAEGRIIHVGIMLKPDEIIHASGRVKIDRIDEDGIYSEELSRYTHKLRVIKRYH